MYIDVYQYQNDVIRMLYSLDIEIHSNDLYIMAETKPVRFNFSITEKLALDIRSFAARHNRSISNFVSLAVEEKIKAEKENESVKA